MSASILMIVALASLAAGYVVYGRYLANRYGLDPHRPTPAHTRRDGVDYVPAKVPVLMGHHFASIAGAAPIIGPVVAATFGWVPVLLWILIGSIFMGGVHDFSALVASVRHGGGTMGEVIEEYVGRTGKRLFLVFAWSLVVLVISVFAHSVSNVFVKAPATASSSFLFIVIALAFGLSVYRLKAPLWVSSIVGVALIGGCIAMGLKFPCELPADTWKVILFVYVFFASVTPVWILLQPRDYLCSFLLCAVIIAGVIGIFAANPQIQSPSLTAFSPEGVGAMFPILFVTVACGAISGFHSLVSAGTTAKQLDRETDAKPVAYGSMLVEGLLAVMALITATAITRGQYTKFMGEGGGGAIAVFSTGLGTFLAKLGISQQAGTTFAALAISAFALTTLDTATRLGRFMFQEFFEEAGKKTFLSTNRYVGTLVTIVAAAALTFTGSRATLWPLFGSANQLLASLTFLAITVWLTRLGRTSTFIKIPMVFMFCVTITALAFLVYKNLRDRNYVLVVMAMLLLGVAVTLVTRAWASLVGTPASAPQDHEERLHEQTQNI